MQSQESKVCLLCKILVKSGHWIGKGSLCSTELDFEYHWYWGCGIQNPFVSDKRMWDAEVASDNSPIPLVEAIYGCQWPAMTVKNQDQHFLSLSSLQLFPVLFSTFLIFIHIFPSSFFLFPCTWQSYSTFHLATEYRDKMSSLIQLLMVPCPTLGHANQYLIWHSLHAKIRFTYCLLSALIHAFIHIYIIIGRQYRKIKTWINRIKQ